MSLPPTPCLHPALPCPALHCDARTRRRRALLSLHSPTPWPGPYTLAWTTHPGPPAPIQLYLPALLYPCSHIHP